MNNTMNVPMVSRVMTSLLWAKQVKATVLNAIRRHARKSLVNQVLVRLSAAEHGWVVCPGVALF